MKRLFVLSFSCILLLSCGKKVLERDNDYSHFDKLYCEFLSMDAYKNEIELINVSNSTGTRFGYIMRLQVWSNEIGFLSQNRMTGESIAAMEKDLADTLSHYLFKYDTGVGSHLKVIYGGITGPVRIYADEVTDGRLAGDDLSDLFMVSTRGIISYPDMKLVVDEHHKGNRDNGQADYYEIDFSDFFSKGTVPFGVDYDVYLYPKEGYSYLMDGTLTVHLEIPISGLTTDGQEKSTVLKGLIPSK